jgi:membrane fusion protein (multidrug efflux system)
MAQVTPLISGSVIEVKAKDTQQVQAGQVLVLLDPADARIAVAQAKAALAEAQRQFQKTVATNTALAATVSARGADITQAQAQLNAAKADYDKARIDLNRREALAASGAVSGQELTDARKAMASAKAALATAQAGVAQAQSTRSSAEGELAANQALVSGSTEDTDPTVLAAKAKLDSAQLDLSHTVIRAPISGIVS